MQHDLLKLLLPHRSHAPLPQSVRDPADILDCGYGTGDWAVEVAELFPDCKVSHLIFKLHRITGYRSQELTLTQFGLSKMIDQIILFQR